MGTAKIEKLFSKSKIQKFVKLLEIIWIQTLTEKAQPVIWDTVQIGALI